MCFQVVDFETKSSKSAVSKSFFLENYGTSGGAISHIVIYYQPLPITHHQERLYANNYFESTAFSDKCTFLVYSANFTDLPPQAFASATPLVLQVVILSRQSNLTLGRPSLTVTQQAAPNLQEAPCLFNNNNNNIYEFLLKALDTIGNYSKESLA